MKTSQRSNRLRSLLKPEKPVITKKQNANDDLIVICDTSNGKYYYLNEQNNSLYGVMFTGWIHRNGATYYCDESGAMVEGWKEIDGEWYYFYPGSGNMAINTYIGSYYVNNDGIWQH
jgi:hypothetical protein